MRTRLISLVAALATLAPVMAHANASSAAGFTWTGMFIGINAGYGRGSSDWDLSGAGSGSSDRTMSGGFIGLQAGYNAQLQNNIVAGIEASIEATNGIDGKKGCAGSSCTTSIPSLSDVSARLGLNYNTSLLFLKGGVAYENADHRVSPYAEDHGGKLGVIAGAGVEFYIDNNITSNIEYNFYHFSDDTAQSGPVRINSDENISLVKAGLNLKFN